MNTVQLECFTAVAEHLNFSKASKALKLTQPAVSHQIQALEEELEVKLFNRTSKNVTLTAEGVLFLADAQLILKTALSAKERLKNHEDFMAFDLDCHNHMVLNLLPPILKELLAEFPLLRPTLHLVPFPSLLSMVENGRLHAALGTKDEQKKTFLPFKEFFTAPIACVCSPNHPLAGYKALTKRQLSGNFIACSPRHVSDSIFTVQSSILANLPPEQRFFTESIESALTLVKAQIGYTLYPDIPTAREPGLCYIPVTNLPSIAFGIYYQYNSDYPVLQRFLLLLSQHMEKPLAQSDSK